MNRLLYSPSALSRTALFCLAATVVFPAAALAHTTPEPALQAQEMLGDGIWSQVVKLRNENESSRYPDTLYATVFEFDEMLWLYTSTGTQPIRSSRNRVDDYRDNLLPLLKSIEHGFTSMRIVPAEETAGADFAQLKNGCVIESIFSLEELRRKGEDVENAQLLLYSATRNTRRNNGENPRGHAVLIFETPEGVFYVDPPKIDVVKQFENSVLWDPKNFAASIEAPYGEAEIQDAFFVPADMSELPVAEPELYSGED